MCLVSVVMKCDCEVAVVIGALAFSWPFCSLGLVCS